MRRPMTAEEVSDDSAYWWNCTACLDAGDAAECDTFDKAKRAATKHTNDTGHATRFSRQHTHVTEVREIPT